MGGRLKHGKNVQATYIGPSPMRADAPVPVFGALRRQGTMVRGNFSADRKFGVGRPVSVGVRAAGSPVCRKVAGSRQEGSLRPSAPHRAVSAPRPPWPKWADAEATLGSRRPRTFGTLPQALPRGPSRPQCAARAVGSLRMPQVHPARPDAVSWAPSCNSQFKDVIQDGL